MPDTREERQTAVSFLLPFQPRGVEPDPGIDQAERQAAVLSYSGILAGETEPEPEPSFSGEPLVFSQLEVQLSGSKYYVTGLMTIHAGGGKVMPTALGLGAIDTFRADPVGGYVPHYEPTTGVLTLQYGDHDSGADGVLIADPDAVVANVPFEASGV